MENDSYPQAGTEIFSPSHLGPHRDQDYAELQVSNRKLKDSVLKSHQATTLIQQGQDFKVLAVSGCLLCGSCSVNQMSRSNHTLCSSSLLCLNTCKLG